jgi:hypothetical protein
LFESLVDRLTTQTGFSSELADASRLGNISDGRRDERGIIDLQSCLDIGDLLLGRLEVV